jgi:hypothetical protein
MDRSLILQSSAGLAAQPTAARLEILFWRKHVVVFLMLNQST